MQRPDPFFQTHKPHKNGYLESLHRTYGEPKSALPTRGDALYQRALEFRQNEKAKYSQIEADARTAREEADTLRARYNALQTETQEIKRLFEQLSKLQTNDVHPSADSGAEPHASRSGAGEPAVASAGVDHDADGSAGAGSRSSDVRIPNTDKNSDEGVGGVVPDEVLPGGGDVRRQAAEHTTEGSKSGSRSAEAKESAGSERSLQQD
ncbi:MAG: hypothetical protein CMO41_04430 [Verrucomicrobiales bacterium]|nr:hypothetical protein [Verrucomicrobiales bacterium]